MLDCDWILYSAIFAGIGVKKMSEKSLIDVYLTSMNEAWRKATNNPKEKDKAETNSIQDLESENKETFASVISIEKAKLSEADTGNSAKDSSEDKDSSSFTGEQVTLSKINKQDENFNVATEDTDYSETNEKYIDGEAVIAEKRRLAEQDKTAHTEDIPLRHVALPDEDEDKQDNTLNVLSSTESDYASKQLQSNKEDLEKKWVAIDKKVNISDYSILSNLSDSLMQAIKMDSNVLIGKEA